MLKKMSSSMSVIFLISSLLTVNVHAASGAAVNSGITFYKDANYSGTAVTLGVGDYTMNQMNAAGIPNDWMSSLVIPKGYLVEVYDNDNFTGTKWTYISNLSYVGADCNDKMSSFKILAAMFYIDANYGGTSVALQPGSYTMAQMNAAGIPNDWMSSLKVPKGWTVEVYQHHDFTGTKWTYTSDSPLISSDANNQMSSVKIYNSTPTTIGDWSNFQTPTVVFQDQAQGLEGSSIFQAAIPNVEKMMQ
ncbi:MAG: peptidase inhibitor family I36 protein, partial [Clostridiaceae bacterium]|nr:peptidase inhibitor family I36 protein [Clostridiaceae bacterium]